MIYFPALRTKLATIKLKEVSIIDAIQILAIPVQNDEASVTAFLSAVIESVTGLPENNADWTIEYRTLAVCHYLASVLPSGPDFSLESGSAKFSDYFDGAHDAIPATFEIGTIGGDIWRIRPLTGRMAESIERCNGTNPQTEGVVHWTVGAMACQLYRDEGDVMPDDGADDWLTERMAVILSYPETEFSELMEAWQGARLRLYHLFELAIAEDGLLVLPKGGAAGLPSARFPVHTCFTETARRMGGRHD